MHRRKPRDVVRRNRGHLGRHHAAHGMADKDRVLQLQRIDDVPGVQREVEHVAQDAAFLRVAIARQQRRIDVEFLREFRQQRIVRHDAAGAVQEHKRLALPAFEIADGNVRCGDSFRFHHRLP